jgi:hypothetical protein
MSNHLRRIEAVEKDLKSLASSSSKKEDVHKLREEMKKVYVSAMIQKWSASDAHQEI